MKRKLTKAEIKAIRARKRAEDSLVQLVKRVLKQSSYPHKKITYGDLAWKIRFRNKHGEGNARLMGRVLGDMRRLLDALSNGKDIPHIQSLVGRKSHPLWLPGKGIGDVWPNYHNLTEQGKINKVRKEYDDIVKFGHRWKKVLSSLSLLPGQKKAPKKTPKKTPKKKSIRRRGRIS